MKKTIAALLSAAFLLSGCSAKIPETPPAHTHDLFAMDTFMTMKAYGDKAPAALDTAAEEITALEKTLSVTDENSDISKINSTPGELVHVSHDAAELIRAGTFYGDLTMGALDITIYPVLRLWGFTTGEYQVPEPDQINALLENVDFRHIGLDGDRVSIPEGYMVDVGALAKGYTSDKVIDILRENGVESAIISLGGNVQTLGAKPEGSLWSVAVRDPFVPDEQMCILSVGEKAVITSGSYERYFTDENGKDYWHIIDPSDGCPADNGLVSVTVIGDSGLKCDALSTALFVCGTDKAVNMWRRQQDFDMILVTDDHRLLITEGIENSFENTGTMETEVLRLE